MSVAEPNRNTQLTHPPPQVTHVGTFSRVNWEPWSRPKAECMVHGLDIFQDCFLFSGIPERQGAEAAVAQCRAALWACLVLEDVYGARSNYK